MFIGVAQEKAKAFSGKSMPEKGPGWFEYTRDKTVYVNHYYFYVDDEEFGPAFVKVCSYAPWALKMCLNGHEWAKRQLEQTGDRLHGVGQWLSRRVPIRRQLQEDV